MKNTWANFDRNTNTNTNTNSKINMNTNSKRNTNLNSKRNTNTNSKRNTNTAVEYVALNGFVREKYLDKCFPRGALSSREEKETMLKKIQKLIQRNTKSTITNINKYKQILIQIMRR